MYVGHKSRARRDKRETVTHTDFDLLGGGGGPRCVNQSSRPSGIVRVFIYKLTQRHKLLSRTPDARLRVPGLWLSKPLLKYVRCLNKSSGFWEAC